MAKCIMRFVAKPDITLIEDDKNGDDDDFIIEATVLGEKLIEKRLESISYCILAISEDFHTIRHSTLSDDEKFDCKQIQEQLVSKLEKLFCDSLRSTQKLCNSTISTFNKHRYFLLYSSGTIENLRHLLLSVGRLSELEQKFFNQRSSFISDESIAIHSLAIIWSAVIDIMMSFTESAEIIYKQALEDPKNKSLRQMEFFTAGNHHAKVFLMDLIITSWMKFNRLVKYEDLFEGQIEGSPLLCPCNLNLYFSILEKAIGQESTPESLIKMLTAFTDQRLALLMTTESTRSFDIVPIHPCYIDTNVSNLAYFVIWHIYSIYRQAEDTHQPRISACSQVVKNSINLALKQFPIANSNEQTTSILLSPHQEERFKLLFSMLDIWCEKHQKEENIPILTEMFAFFEENWKTYNENYYDNNNFRINGLTVFQLFTKLLNMVIPIYTFDGQASEGNKLTEQEIKLKSIWDKLLAKSKPPESRPPDKSNPPRSTSPIQNNFLGDRPSTRGRPRTRASCI